MRHLFERGGDPLAVGERGRERLLAEDGPRLVGRAFHHVEVTGGPCADPHRVDHVDEFFQ